MTALDLGEYRDAPTSKNIGIQVRKLACIDKNGQHIVPLIRIVLPHVCVERGRVFKLSAS